MRNKTSLLADVIITVQRLARFGALLLVHIAADGQHACVSRRTWQRLAARDG
jgi:hypothetical protein